MPITGDEVCTLTIKSYGLSLTVEDAPGQYTELVLDDSENIQRVSMQFCKDEVRMLVGFLQGTLDR